MAMFRSKPFKATFDPAFDDLDLAEARDELSQGRWDPARDLLEDSRRNWDRRSHRVRVLADAAAGTSWVERWQSMDQHNPEAAVLRGQIEVVRALRAHAAAPDGGRPRALREAEEHCRRAVALTPQDPTPWISLIALARVQGVGRDEFWQRWQGLRERDEWSRDGHHQTLIYLFAAWQGSQADMYDYAYWLAGEAPAGSPLAILPLVAHAESFRVRQADGRDEAPSGLNLHWTQPQVGVDLDAALNTWFRKSNLRHAQAKADLNYLAHALIYADRAEDARPVMRAIDTHATQLPWVYTGAAESTFAYWRNRLVSE
jgi:hypothetical protein